MKSFSKVRYADLDSRQQEQYNFQKVSAVLADYGFQTIKLTTDWESADFIAQHIDGQTFLKVQLKGRLSFDQKYAGKDIWICFRNEDGVYMYPHDELRDLFLENTNIRNTDSWKSGAYNYRTLSPELKALIEPFRLK